MHRTHAIELFSPLLPAECASRLANAITHERSTLLGAWRFHEHEPVIGRIRDQSFELRKCNLYHNALQPVLAATLLPHSDGTVVRGKFRLQHGVPFVMRFVFVAAIVFAGVGVFLFALNLFQPGNANRGNAWVGLACCAIPYLMYRIVFAIFRFAARHEARFLTEFLAELFSAHPAPLPVTTSA